LAASRGELGVASPPREERKRAIPVKTKERKRRI
jgi:hypothetical protein